MGSACPAEYWKEKNYGLSFPSYSFLYIILKTFQISRFPLNVSLLILQPVKRLFLTVVRSLPLSVQAWRYLLCLPRWSTMGASLWMAALYATSLFVMYVKWAQIM